MEATNKMWTSDKIWEPGTFLNEEKPDRPELEINEDIINKSTDEELEQMLLDYILVMSSEDQNILANRVYDKRKKRI